MTPERIRFKLSEARFFLDCLNRDLPSMGRQHPEVIEYLRQRLPECDAPRPRFAEKVQA